jgi:DNA polymerase-3 subunit epsilon
MMAVSGLVWGQGDFALWWDNPIIEEDLPWREIFVLGVSWVQFGKIDKKLAITRIHRLLGDYREMRQNVPAGNFCLTGHGERMMDYGVIVDLETTGLDSKSDKIIEIGLIEFGVEGQDLPVITRCYSSLQDPGMAVSEDVLRITGLTQASLQGQSIDWDTVRSFVERSSLVIAHNADFDRGFLDASGHLAGLNLHWACSMRHINWRKHRFNSLSLNYLAADHGFVNPFAHRAIFDCATTFRIVSPHLQELIQRSYEPEFTIKAVGSPFESKDVLKHRGYRWDQQERCWHRVVPESELADERRFLADEVYKGQPRHQEIEMRP